jgi:hypothetical protein
MKLLAGIAMVALALALAMAGCGGDDDGSTAATQATTTETTGQGSSGQGSSGQGSSGQGDPAKTPEELASCLEDAGLEPTSIPPPSEGEPGSEYGTVGSVRVGVGSDNGVVAIFFESTKEADAFTNSPLGKQAETSKVVGAAYVTATQGKPAELGDFEACLEG